MISINSINYLLKSKFNNLYIKEIKLLSSTNEYITCLINDEYIFNIILNPSETKKYSSEKDNLDFLRKNLDTNISLPNIEYSFISDDVVIKGYKKIEGIPLNINIFRLMPKESQDKLAKDIALFLKQLHSLSLSNESYDLKNEMLKEINLIKENIYGLLNSNEKNYIDIFLELLDKTPLLICHECLSHNSLSYSRFIIDQDNDLVGVVGFDELGNSPIYTDFISLLDDEEISKKIISYYGEIDYDTLIQYKDIIDRYYPIKRIAYGLKNNRNDIVEHNRRKINSKELGGKIITIGSDAHKKEDLASNFDVAYDMLESAEFNNVAIYHNRQPEFIKIKNLK